MIRKIIISILVSLLLFSVQFVLIPFVSIQGVIPNLVVIYVVLFSLKHGQFNGTLFGFVIGFFFDLFSSGLIGCAMLSLTISGFVAGYFYKDDYFEIISNIKLFVLVVFISASMFFILYSLFGLNETEIHKRFSLTLFALFSAFYTTLFSLSIYLIPRKKHE